MHPSNIILSSIILSLPALLCSCTLGIEKPQYTVLQKQGSFEIRKYPAYLVAQTAVDADFENAGNLAFRRLFNYISGSNRTSTSIAMTAPVNQTSTSEKIAMTAPVNQQKAGQQYLISFIMPAKYSLEDLPEPLDPAVTIQQIPEYKAAVIRYSGTWSQKRYEQKKTDLKTYLEQNRLTPAGEPIFARYNPPFELWFLRRNEVIIPIKE